jgi:hypothetical protein
VTSRKHFFFKQEKPGRRAPFGGNPVFAVYHKYDKSGGNLLNKIVFGKKNRLFKGKNRPELIMIMAFLSGQIDF